MKQQKNRGFVETPMEDNVSGRKSGPATKRKVPDGKGTPAGQKKPALKVLKEQKKRKPTTQTQVESDKDEAPDSSSDQTPLTGSGFVDFARGEGAMASSSDDDSDSGSEAGQDQELGSNGSAESSSDDDLHTDNEEDTTEDVFSKLGMFGVCTHTRLAKNYHFHHFILLHHNAQPYNSPPTRLQGEDIPTGSETYRFACVDMDWDNVHAADLYKAFDSFKPKEGRVVSVKVYPSEFGRERIEKVGLLFLGAGGLG